jgi:hypothetical protein
VKSSTTILPDSQNALINALSSLGGGHLLTQAAEDMQAAVKAAMMDGSATSVTIRLEFKKTTPETLAIKGSSKATIPVLKPASMFFVNDQYLPSRDRPNQQLMNFS